MKNLNNLLKILIMLFSKGYLYNKKSNRISNYSIKYNCKIISYICLDVNFYQMLPGSILPVLLLVPPGCPPAATQGARDALPTYTICMQSSTHG